MNGVRRIILMTRGAKIRNPVGNYVVGKEE